MSDDEDSFNQRDEEDGHLSDDSFNDAPDGDEESFGSPTNAARPADAHADATHTAVTSTSTSSSSATTTKSTQLAFQINEKQGDYAILDEGELRAAMESLTKDVASVLHVPTHLASCLLRTHNWNKERFVTQYFEDPARLLEKLGLQFMADDGQEGGTRANVEASEGPSANTSTEVSLNSATASANSTAAPSSSASTSSSSLPGGPTASCPVCYDDYPLDQIVALGCGHVFCHTCWCTYLTTAVNDGKLCILTHCAAFKCPILVPDKTFKNLTAPETFARHQHYLVRSYVEDNRLLRWCPAQRCTYAVRSFNSSLAGVKCKCGFAFCFRCGEESHAPAGCDQLSQWLQKCKNESETAHWIIANTRKCPKCAIRIEKNQGCNHMTCRGCKFEWCWVCNGDWQQHGNQTGGYYKCFGPDTRVLTSDGFLFEPQIATAMADKSRPEPLLFACYDRQAGALVYRSGQLVYPENTTKRLITFDQDHVLLRVTPEHDMYVQVSTGARTPSVSKKKVKTSASSSSMEHESMEDAEDDASDEEADDGEERQTLIKRRRGGQPTPGDEYKGRFKWQRETVDGKRVLAPPMKRTAQALLSDFSEKGIRFQAVAAAGVAHNNAESPFIAQCGLQTPAEIDAFLELYGFWLGDGTIYRADSWYGANAIGFNQKKVADSDFLRDILPKCGLAEDEWKEEQDGVFIVLRQSWFDLFWAEYGKKYGHTRAERAAVVAPTEAVEIDEWLFGWVLKRLSTRQCRLLLRGLWRADGSWASQLKRIWTSSMSFRDELCALLLHCGYTARFFCQYEAGAVRGYNADAQTWGSAPLREAVAGSSKAITATAASWAVDWSEAASSQDVGACYPTFDGAQIRTEDYGGAVWCVRVEHEDHLIVAQGTEMKDGRVVRAGRPLIVGQCNRWDPKAEAKQAAKGSPEEAKAELNRYLHYYQRYHNHDQSKRFAEKQKVQTEKRMATLHAQSGGDAAWIDFQFMAAATQQVLECRNVLKYTYVFAYFLESGPEKTLFEFLQQQLESANEHLSELSELPPIDKIDRAQIVNYTRITKQFQENLLNGVAAGLTPQ